PGPRARSGARAGRPTRTRPRPPGARAHATTSGDSSLRASPPSGSTDTGQYESALITSLPARVPSPHQTCIAIAPLTKRAEPSAMVQLTPPGWKLVALANWAASTLQLGQPNRQLLHGYCTELGGTTVLNCESPVVPQPQRSPRLTA